MGHDYRGFQDKIGADMASASASAMGMEKGGKGTKVRIRQSDLEHLIPSGSMIDFSPVAAHRLKFGDVVFVRAGKEMVLRRFIGFQIGKTGSVVAVARANPAKREVYPDTAVVGKVNSVESKGVSFDPLKKESQLARWKNELTFFGTSSLFARIGQNLKVFGKMMKKK
ncbi:hypothetical protein JST97_04175 [bacterium]|nr:hypothetical protein [bacterium]